ncbi:MAG: MlaD family protein [Bacteroidia bacterium]
MAEQSLRNIRLGTFVLIGTLLLVGAFYFMGSRQNLFGSTFSISANFHNVNGLMKGNNVRFAGIDVGTVESVEILSDTSVKVTMVIEKNIQQFIRKNATVGVGTDGLMGNKLVNINSATAIDAHVEDGDILQTVRPVEMDEMVRTLNVTNENIKAISTNLRDITDKISSRNSLWSLLMDTVVADNIKSSVVNLRLMSNQAVYVTGNLGEITKGIKNGKGSIGALITDTTLSSRINQTVIRLERISDTAAYVSGNISQIVKKLKRGEGSVGVLLNDTMLVHNLNKSMQNIRNGTGNFNENMEALKYSWPFKKYFKKKKNKHDKKK